jgi:methylphosphotriester-DNA--protein-cysteine methyltransferase
MEDQTASLQLLSSELQTLLRNGDEESWRNFARDCARSAVDKNQVSDDVVIRALAMPIDEARSLRDMVQAVADKYDEEAFDIRDAAKAGRGPTMDDYSRLFRKSRAATAVVAYLEQDPLSAAAWAAYEAVHSVAESDPAVLRLAENYFQAKP